MILFYLNLKNIILQKYYSLYLNLIYIKKLKKNASKEMKI